MLGMIQNSKNGKLSSLNLDPAGTVVHISDNGHGCILRNVDVARAVLKVWFGELYSQLTCAASKL